MPANVYNLTEIGAIGGDWGAPLQQLVDAAYTAGGGMILVPPGTYAMTTGVLMREAVHIQGVEAPRWLAASASTTTFQAATGFAGDAMFTFADKDSTGHPVDPSGGSLRALNLDGNGIGSGVAGVDLIGTCPDNALGYLNVRGFSGDGLRTADYSGDAPQLIHAEWVYCYGNAGHGFNIQSCADSQFVSCEAAANTGNGWDIPAGLGNSELLLCSAEWNRGHGFYFYDTNDGPQLTLISTDSNYKHGVYFGSAPSNQVVQVNGLKTRRDGYNSGSGGGDYAGLAILGTSGSYAPPVQVNGLVQEVARDDDGVSGPYRPQIGVKVTYAGQVTINGRVWGQATAVSDAFTSDVDYGFGTVLTTGDPGSETDTKAATVESDGSLSMRYSGTTYTKITPYGYIDITEASTPSAPAANKCRLFVRDNGSGKTQLCALFSSGAVQVIATQP